MGIAFFCLILFTMSCCFGWCTRQERRQLTQSGRTADAFTSENHVTWFQR
jgi:hypothetical protein